MDFLNGLFGNGNQRPLGSDAGGPPPNSTSNTGSSGSVTVTPGGVKGDVKLKLGWLDLNLSTGDSGGGGSQTEQPPGEQGPPPKNETGLLWLILGGFIGGAVLAKKGV